MDQIIDKGTYIPGKIYYVYSSPDKFGQRIENIVQFIDKDFRLGSFINLRTEHYIDYSRDKAYLSSKVGWYGRLANQEEIEWLGRCIIKNKYVEKLTGIYYEIY